MARHFQPDERHNITDPYADPVRWAESVKKTRINDLFRTQGGLDGHVTQVQQEIRRVVSDRNVSGKMEGMDGGAVANMMTAVESIKDSIVSAAKAADFDFAKFGMDFGFGTPMYLEKRGGKLFRDGKSA